MWKSEIRVKQTNKKVVAGKDRVGRRGERRVTERDVGNGNKCENQKYQINKEKEKERKDRIRERGEKRVKGRMSERRVLKSG